MAYQINYNERSWGIDLIAHIQRLCQLYNRIIKGAGGEQTIKTVDKHLFPDVILFGSPDTATILQGWELKMPDTSIDDPEFRQNAEIKARALGLNSFLLWNVSYARLFVLDTETDNFECVHEWDELRDLTARADVQISKARWESLAEIIFLYLNDLFENGNLTGRPFIESWGTGEIANIIMDNAGSVGRAVRQAEGSNVALRMKITLWWNQISSEYHETDKYFVLGKAILFNWLAKIIFANILCEQDSRAREVMTLGPDTSVSEAIYIFEALSKHCDFWLIFSNTFGLCLLPDFVWSQVKELNSLLAELRIGAVNQTKISDILEATVNVGIRKVRGQYATPASLATFLVNLTTQNIREDRVLDPCCGSGAIARAALEQKLKFLSPNDAVSKVFACDIDPYATQIATFALTRPELMNVALRIFQHNAFSLEPETSLDFRNPNNGEIFSEKLGKFESVICNLPFINQAGRSLYENDIRTILNVLCENGEHFTRRADISAYFPFSLHKIIARGGRLGIIITNAWLGTEWGNDFSRLLRRYYNLKYVITSGSGRWFTNADIVTNILIMDKKESPDEPDSNINFVKLNISIEELSKPDICELASAQIRLGCPNERMMSLRTVTPENLDKFRDLGLAGSAQFVDCDWLLSIPLVPLTTYFIIRRGERRGLNALFYPSGIHGIEAEYIKPLVKSLADFDYPVYQATKEAFSCQKTIEELTALGHTGAVKWIKRFETPENIRKLQKPGLHWYEMKADALTELVMSINYGERIFVGRVSPPAFVDQRFIRLNPIGNIDIDLAHAIMNSAITLFIIEGLGFARGLGALDLSKDRIEKYMRIPKLIDIAPRDCERIKLAYQPLLARPVLKIQNELEEADRQHFDDTIIDVLGIDINRDHIYSSLLELVTIRNSH